MSLVSNSKSIHEPRFGMMRAEKMFLLLVPSCSCFVEEDAGAVQLRDHHALGTVHDEGSGLGHKRDLTEVDLLLLDVRHGAGLGLGIDVPDDEANGDLEGGREGHAALAALITSYLGCRSRRTRTAARRAGEVLDREHALEDRLKTVASRSDCGRLICRNFS